MFSHHRRRWADQGKIKLEPEKPKPFKCSDYLCSRCHKRLKIRLHNRTKFIQMSYDKDNKPVFEVIQISVTPQAEVPLYHWCFHCIADAPTRAKAIRLSRGKVNRIKAKIDADQQAKWKAMFERQKAEQEERDSKKKRK